MHWKPKPLNRTMLSKPGSSRTAKPTRSRRKPTQETPDEIIRKLQRLPGNKSCADCGGKVREIYTINIMYLSLLISLDINASICYVLNILKCIAINSSPNASTWPMERFYAPPARGSIASSLTKSKISLHHHSPPRRSRCFRFMGTKWSIHDTWENTTWAVVGWKCRGTIPIWTD